MKCSGDGRRGGEGTGEGNGERGMGKGGGKEGGERYELDFSVLLDLIQTNL